MTRDRWIIDVLTDLRAFAAANGLPRTAEGAEALCAIAADELSTRAARDPAGDGGPATSGSASVLRAAE